MNPCELKVGEIVQIDPALTTNRGFAGCLMVVTEPRAWGAQGFVWLVGTRGTPPERAYFRVEFEDMEQTGGMAVWLPADELAAPGPLV